MPVCEPRDCARMPHLVTTRSSGGAQEARRSPQCGELALQDLERVDGRGFGTIDPDQPNQFRINDDEYIDEIWEVGVIGLVAYLFMIVAPVLAARRAIRARDPVIEPPSFGYRLDDPFSWLIAGCIVIILAAVLADWFVLRPRRTGN